MKLEIRFGDITTLSIEAIVNASNESGLGCHTPNHPCIDNAIHKVAGPELYRECLKLGGIPTGVAKLTKGYKLPAKYIIHATGPTSVNGHEDHELLAKTYISILDLAKKNGIREIAFCCISTGMYGFDKDRGARTHLSTVHNWLYQKGNEKVFDRIVFNVFTEEDLQIYRKLSGIKN